MPIVALTANALKGDRERFLAEGMDEYITKPIETAELLYILNKFLSQKAVSGKKQKAAPESLPVKNEAEETAVPEIAEVETGKEKTDEEIIYDLGISEESGKKILIAKKFLLESRVLKKVMDNLGYEYTILENLSDLEAELASDNYDILFTDDDLVTDTISNISSNIAIITAQNSKAQIESIIQKHRG